MANKKRKSKLVDDGSLTTLKKHKASATVNSEKVAKSGAIIDTKPRRSFLSLPRELRQAIFIHAKPIGQTFTGEKRLIEKIGKSWKIIHVDLIDDVAYAKKKWLEMLTTELKSTGRNWEYLEEIQTRFGRSFSPPVKHVWIKKSGGLEIREVY